MISTPIAMEVPLLADSDGTIRVANTRVTLETIVGAFERGDTPDEILEGFPTLRLADIYAVIAYYLDHRVEVDAYIQQQEAEGRAIRQQMEAEFPEMVRTQEKFRALVPLNP